MKLNQKATVHVHEPMEGVEGAVLEVLKSLGVEWWDDNFEDTPKRVAEYLKSHFLPDDKVRRELKELQASVFPSSYRGMIAQKGIRAFGICPHHLLPIVYEVSLAYIPSGTTIGLSKLSRAAELMCSLPVLHEDATVNLANALEEMLGTEHVIVVLEGVHFCMKCRGVKQDDASTITCEVRGHFAVNDRDCKSEFFKLIGR